MAESSHSTDSRITFTLNGERVEVAAGTSLAAAVWNHGARGFRASVGGQARAPLCGMGICFECRLTVDGRPGVRSCRLPVRQDMDVTTDRIDGEGPGHA